VLARPLLYGYLARALSSAPPGAIPLVQACQVFQRTRHLHHPRALELWNDPPHWTIGPGASASSLRSR